jgi:hypothetical protein
MKLDLIPIKKIKRYLIVTICLIVINFKEAYSLTQNKPEIQVLKDNNSSNIKIPTNNLKKETIQNLKKDLTYNNNSSNEIQSNQIINNVNNLNKETNYSQYNNSYKVDNNNVISNANKNINSNIQFTENYDYYNNLVQDNQIANSSATANDIRNFSQNNSNNLANNNFNVRQNNKQYNQPTFRFKSNTENNNSNNLKNRNSNMNTNQNSLPYSQYETPVIRHHVPPKPVLAVEAQPIPLPLGQERVNPYMSIQQSPYMLPGKTRASLVPSPLDLLVPDMRMRNNLYKVCPCAGTVRCPPCGIIQSAYPQSTCSCAPPPICNKCPPLSLVHEIASRKALQDQRLASELQNLSNSMTKMFKSISKFAGDVLKFETEAKEASLRMEEASLKAQFSRQEMERTSEKARLIAKNTLTRPCLVNCGRVPSDPGEILGMNAGTALGNFIDDSKIFPQEVDSIGEYMKDTYSTNINGYNAREREILANNRLENESEGNITVEPLGENEMEGTKSMTSNQKKS